MKNAENIVKYVMFVLTGIGLGHAAGMGLVYIFNVFLTFGFSITGTAYEIMRGFGAVGAMAGLFLSLGFGFEEFILDGKKE